VGGVGAMRLEPGGDGGGADERRERRLEIGGEGRLMETRRRGHGSGRMALHIRHRQTSSRARIRLVWSANGKWVEGGSQLPPEGKQEQALLGVRGASQWISASGRSLGQFLALFSPDDRL